MMVVASLFTVQCRGGDGGGSIPVYSVEEGMVMVASLCTV